MPSICISLITAFICILAIYKLRFKWPVFIANLKEKRQFFQLRKRVCWRNPSIPFHLVDDGSSQNLKTYDDVEWQCADYIVILSFVIVGSRPAIPARMAFHLLARIFQCTQNTKDQLFFHIISETKQNLFHSFADFRGLFISKMPATVFRT